MIEVYVVKNNAPLAKIEIKNEETYSTFDGTDYGFYTVKFAVERGSAVGMHTRSISNFPRNRYNVLALVRQALNTLEEKELKLEDDFDPNEATVSSDLARRLSGALREIQAGFSRLHRH